MRRSTTRRQFLKTSSTAAGAALLPIPTFATSTSPSEKMNVGIIGVGGRGAHNMGQMRGERVVALCDVDERQLGRARKQHPDAKRYYDFRKLLDQKDLDAVVISTTDHTHALASVPAMRRGLHVYSEKPLAHSVEEARLVRDTYVANRKKIATQMGTQIHATENYRRVVEAIQAGSIGKVREAHVWCNRKSSQAAPPSGSTPVPKWLKWDLWLGPARFRPYQNGYLPGNLTWNRYWDMGNGILGDMGSHLIDLPYWALDLQFPKSCEAAAPPAHPVIYPTRLTLTWEHPKRGEGPHQAACKLIWYDGHAKPNHLLGVDVSKYGIGVLFVGEKGKLLADYGRINVLPNDGEDARAVPKKSIPKSIGHHREWIHACKTDPTKTLCNFDYSGKLIEHNLLGAVAHRIGKKLEWDHEKLEATNAPEAEALIRKARRKGWEYGEV
jgi:predicted dehydrogenase